MVHYWVIMQVITLHIGEIMSEMDPRTEYGRLKAELGNKIKEKW